MSRWKTNKNETLFINFFYLKFKSVNCLNMSGPFKHLSRVLVWCRSQNIFSDSFLAIAIELSLTEFIFSKVPCFQHILLIIRGWLHLVLDIQTTFRQQKPHCNNFWWKHIKNESCKSYLGTKEQKAMLLVVLDRTYILVLRAHFFACPIGRVSKMYIIYMYMYDNNIDTY